LGEVSEQIAFRAGIDAVPEPAPCPVGVLAGPEAEPIVMLGSTLLFSLQQAVRPACSQNTVLKVKFQDCFAEVGLALGQRILYAATKKIMQSRRRWTTNPAGDRRKENKNMKKYVMFIILAAFFATALTGCKKGG
jgi:hypothetical protein